MNEGNVKCGVATNGFSFAGAGESDALVFLALKDWSERSSEQSATMIAGKLNVAFQSIKDAMAFATPPPTISGLGQTNGFTFLLHDQANHGYTGPSTARDRLMAEARESPI